MRIQTNNLIQELQEITAKAAKKAEELQQLSSEKLNYKTDSNNWSVLECIEHLNLYGDYYLPLMEKQVYAAKRISVLPEFKTGILGNYFANVMKEQNGKFKKMKSPKDKDPRHSTLTPFVIERFHKQLELLKTILEESKHIDLNKVKIPISIARFIKLKLGDTLRFYVYHIERHIKQASKTAGIKN